MATASQAVAARPTVWSRVYGFGSVFAKTVRDSRRATIIAAGVTLIETHARETGVPLRRMDVTIEGVRTAAEPNRFASVTMTFELAGVTPAQADALVDVYRQR